MKLRSSMLAIAACTLSAVTFQANASPLSGFIYAPGRADVAYDAAREVLYISGDSTLRRYDMRARSFLSPISIGGSTAGMDISPDGSTLAVANTAFGASQNHVDFINLNNGSASRVGFDRAFYEGGTFTVAYDGAGKLLVSSRYQGSGWVPLRKYDPVSGSSSTLGSVRQNSMLAASGDRTVIGIAENNISDGRWGVYRTGESAYASQHTGYDPVTGGTGWFNFEIGVSRDGAQIAIPTGGGTFVGDAAQVENSIGTYFGATPIGVAYSAISDSVFFPFAGTNYIGEYDTDTLLEIGRYVTPGYFNWVGNHAFVEGRTKVASDGTYVFSTLDDGVFFSALDRISISAPPTVWLISIGMLVLAGRGARRIQCRQN